MNKLPLYFDYAATTPVDPHVAKLMADYLTAEGNFGNPASLTHVYGVRAQQAVERARSEVAALIHANAEDIIWTSGATEANNLAIKGIAHFHHRRGKHIITLATEHKAVLDTCDSLAREGFAVTYLTPEADGLIDLDKLVKAFRKETVLLSVMQVNNEIGVIQDIQAIGKLTHARGIFFHVDAAQSAGKIPIDVKALGVDLLSLASHKVYGPKGIGALYVCQNPRIRLAPFIHGGGHERGLRSGTLPVHQIVGMGKAFELAKRYLPEESLRLKKLREQFCEKLSQVGGIVFNGNQVHCVPGIVNVSFVGVDSEALLTALPDVACSSGSACTTGSLEPSYVLRALGIEVLLARNALRFSFGRFTTAANIALAADKIIAAVKHCHLAT